MNNDIEAARVLKHFMTRCNYNGRYNTTDDYQVSLHDSIYLHNDINKYSILRKIPYKFNTAKTFRMTQIEFDDYDFLPEVCTNMIFENVNLLEKELVIKSHIISSSLLMSACHPQVIKIVNPQAQIRKIDINNSCAQKIFIHENTYVEDYIRLDSLCKLRSLDRECLILPRNNKHIYINKLNLITCFSEQENTINTHNFSIDDLPNLQSWRNIDKIKISGFLKLYRINTYKNIINLMLVDNNCKIVTGFGPLAKYNEISNRSDYIMDFALDLIDAELPLAAEL